MKVFKNGKVKLDRSEVAILRRIVMVAELHVTYPRGPMTPEEKAFAYKFRNEVAR